MAVTIPADLLAEVEVVAAAPPVARLVVLPVAAVAVAVAVAPLAVLPAALLRSNKHNLNRKRTAVSAVLFFCRNFWREYT